VSDVHRYARQTVLTEIGEAGQARLARSTALIVGLGGLGCPASMYLATSGVGTLLLNDFDTVDATNLPRQILYGPGDVGRKKVDTAAERLKSLNPDARIVATADRLDAAGVAALVQTADVVLDGTDNFATRFAVNAACVKARVPLVSGAAVRLEGQLIVFPNRPGGPCYRCLYDETDEWLGDCQGNGVLATVTGVIGTLMAQEAIKTLLGGMEGRVNTLQLWDAKTGDWSTVEVKSNPHCPVCSLK
jgi:molybdopterin/thiamine biosynthesis adenylyltransferase